jgi:CheY-like chemotaxis protein
MSDKKVILLVDDSMVSRMMLKSQITSFCTEWEILEAACGEDALELVKQSSKIDFFSVDLNMPGIDGLELIGKLRNSHPTSQFVLLTANIQEEIIARTKKLGATCFHKPITEEVISQMLEYFNG